MSLPLSEHLPLIASAPDGIQKLRSLILKLAVRGNLVPQDSKDEPASELLKRIEQERAQLEAAGVCKKSKRLLPVSSEEQPFRLPSNWEWVRLPEVYFPISPSSNKLLSSAIQETGAVPVIDQGKRYIAGYTDHASMLIKIPGPVVIFGDHTTERKYVDFDFVAGADGVKILRPILQYEKFFFRQLQGFKLEERGYARHFKVLNDQLYALPPLAEQFRIVAKVDELMALCDRLESEQNDSAAAHTQLVETLLGTLTQSTSVANFEANWKRIVEHFDTLFTTESSIDELQKTILRLAVMGKLVPQSANEESANLLLKQIECERARLETEGTLKKSKPLPAVRENEKSFTAPDGWTWCRLQHAFDVRDGTHDSPKFLTSGIPFLTSKNIYGGKLDLTDLKFISESDHSEFSKRSKVDQDDILFAMIGSIGNPVIVDTDMVFSFKNMALFKYISKELSCPSFLQIFLSVIAAEMKANAAGGVQSFVALGSIRNQPIALPPLSEQHRIVQKVDELMSASKLLKAQLVKFRQQSLLLSTALAKPSLEAA